MQAAPLWEFFQAPNLFSKYDINNCKVVKIGRFLQFSQHSTGQSKADYRNLPNFWNSIIYIELIIIIALR